MTQGQKPKYDPQKHHRRSIRLQGYDYAQAGVYFITIVTYQRKCIFGEIMTGEMVLNHFGIITDECWRAIPEHFTHVELGAYVIIPNHVHGIIIINSPTVGALHVDDNTGSTIYRAPTEQFGKPTPGSLPTIIRTYKAAVTRRIGREFNATGIWQRNYYEHIIRDDREMDNIWHYIEANPLNWNQDTENLDNL